MLQNVEEEATVMGSGKYNSLFDTQDKCNVYTLEIILSFFSGHQCDGCNNITF